MAITITTPDTIIATGITTTTIRDITTTIRTGVTTGLPTTDIVGMATCESVVFTLAGNETAGSKSAAHHHTTLC